jgi:hypothetical protein
LTKNWFIAVYQATFHPEQVEIIDANGAFGLDKALDKITQLSEFKLHSMSNQYLKTTLTGWQTYVKRPAAHCL